MTTQNYQIVKNPSRTTSEKIISTIQIPCWNLTMRVSTVTQMFSSRSIYATAVFFVRRLLIRETMKFTDWLVLFYQVSSSIRNSKPSHIPIADTDVHFCCLLKDYTVEDYQSINHSRNWYLEHYPPTQIFLEGGNC